MSYGSPSAGEQQDVEIVEEEIVSEPPVMAGQDEAVVEQVWRCKFIILAYFIVSLIKLSRLFRFR